MTSVEPRVALAVRLYREYIDGGRTQPLAERSQRVWFRLTPEELREALERIEEEDANLRKNAN